MKIKILAIALVCVFFLACASVERPKREAEFYKFYYEISLNEIWNATLKAIDDIGLVPAEKSKERDFIFAKKRPGHPLRIPSLEIFFGRENGRIKVGCQPILVASGVHRDTLQKEKKRWAEWFFDALEKTLKM